MSLLTFSLNFDTEQMTKTHLSYDTAGNSSLEMVPKILEIFRRLYGDRQNLTIFIQTSVKFSDLVQLSSLFFKDMTFTLNHLTNVKMLILAV